MQGGKTYRIFWNNKQIDFWKYHDLFCEKLGITKDVTVNYYTDVELSEEQIALFQKAIDNGFIRLNKI